MVTVIWAKRLLILFLFTVMIELPLDDHQVWVGFVPTRILKNFFQLKQ